MALPTFQQIIESMDSQPYNLVHEEKYSGLDVIYYFKESDTSPELKIHFEKQANLGKNVFRVLLGQKTPGTKQFKRILTKFKNPLKVLATLISATQTFLADYKAKTHGLAFGLPMDSFGNYSGLIRRVIQRKMNTLLTVDDSTFQPEEAAADKLSYIWVTVKPYKFETTFTGKWMNKDGQFLPNSTDAPADVPANQDKIEILKKADDLATKPQQTVDTETLMSKIQDATASNSHLIKAQSFINPNNLWVLKTKAGSLVVPTKYYATVSKVLGVYAATPKVVGLKDDGMVDTDKLEENAVPFPYDQFVDAIPSGKMDVASLFGAKPKPAEPPKKMAAAKATVAAKKLTDPEAEKAAAAKDKLNGLPEAIVKAVAYNRNVIDMNPGDDIQVSKLYKLDILGTYCIPVKSMDIDNFQVVIIGPTDKLVSKTVLTKTGKRVSTKPTPTQILLSPTFVDSPTKPAAVNTNPKSDFANPISAYPADTKKWLGSNQPGVAKTKNDAGPANSSIYAPIPIMGGLAKVDLSQNKTLSDFLNEFSKLGSNDAVANVVADISQNITERARKAFNSLVQLPPPFSKVKDQEALPLMQYTGSYYNDINKFLRGVNNLNSTTAGMVKKIDDLFSKYGQKYENLIVYRGQSIREEQYKGITQGKPFIMRGYTSTSMGVHTAMHFGKLSSHKLVKGFNGSDQVDGKLYALMVISGLEKTSCIAPGSKSSYPDELEVVLNRGTVLKASGPAYRKEAFCIIPMTVVGQENPALVESVEVENNNDRSFATFKANMEKTTPQRKAVNAAVLMNDVLKALPQEVLDDMVKTFKDDPSIERFCDSED